ncbi:MAG: hypothetical protein ABIR29_03365, partial [Chthoniobacterales bacterium]
MEGIQTTELSEPLKAGSSRAKLFALVSFILSLSFYFGSVLSMPFARTNLLDLGPYPDAVEYFAQANSLVREGRPTLQIGYDRLPSRYPPGYPILMIPWLKAFPQSAIFAPFRTNQAIGLLLLVGSFGLYLAIGRPLAAGWASLLLTTQPAFVTFSRSSMSDLSAGAVTILSFALVYLGYRWLRRWPVYTAAIVLGLSVCIRSQLLFLAPLFIVMAFFPAGDSRARWLVHCVLIVFTFSLSASPYLILNALQFGHPLKTGYEFWVPTFMGQQLPFAFGNVPRQSAMLFSELTATWQQYRVANMFGTGTYVAPLFALLALTGILFVRWGGFAISAFLATGSFLLATVTFSFADVRLYLPALFLSIGLAVLPAEWALEKILRARFSFPAVGLLILAVLSCLGYPSQSGYPPKSGRVQAWDALKERKGHGKSVLFATQEEFMKCFRGSPGIVLSDIDPAYLNALWPQNFVAAPLDAEHHYRYSKRW